MSYRQQSVILPPYIVITSPSDVEPRCYASYTEGGVFDHGAPNHGVYTSDDSLSSMEFSEGSIFSNNVKIEVQRSAINPKYVNLLFCYSNRFWHEGKDGTITAVSKQTQEDTSKPQCTLFQAIKAGDPDGDGDFDFYLAHVQSGGRRLSVDPELGLFKIDKAGSVGTLFAFKNWSMLVKMPEHVAFKGPNSKYLQFHDENFHFLVFKGTDAYDTLSGYKVTNLPDGHIHIKADHNGNLWRRNHASDAPDHILIDGKPSSSASDFLFWPVKLDDATISLRSAGNNKFCNRFTAYGRPESVLMAGVPTMTEDTKIQVKELVSSRKVYGVRYRMEDARVYGETPFVGGKTTVTNLQNKEAAMSVALVYQTEKSSTYSNSLSITAGVSTTITAGVPGIFEADITVSLEVSTSMEWSKTTTVTSSATATGSVDVPALSVARISYVGTKAKCDIPFSYMQQDISSVDGKVHISEHIDGIYSGVDCYNFSFVMEEAIPVVID